MATVLIRDAVLGDMPALREVYRRSSLSNDGDRPHLLANPEVLEFDDRGVREGRTRAAVTGGQIADFASWLGAGEAIEVEDLFVDPGWMRQGFGMALVLDLIAIARGRGTGRVEVTANQHALAFYHKAGFVIYREEATRFGPALRMRLDLTS
jgi:GNAT superfamily N-acetyltransferase